MGGAASTCPHAATPDSPTASTTADIAAAAMTAASPVTYRKAYARRQVRELIDSVATGRVWTDQSRTPQQSVFVWSAEPLDRPTVTEGGTLRPYAVRRRPSSAQPTTRARRRRSEDFAAQVALVKQQRSAHNAGTPSLARPATAGPMPCQRRAPLTPILPQRTRQWCAEFLRLQVAIRRSRATAGELGRRHMAGRPATAGLLRRSWQRTGIVDGKRTLLPARPATAGRVRDPFARAGQTNWAAEVARAKVQRKGRERWMRRWRESKLRRPRDTPAMQGRLWSKKTNLNKFKGE